jgi:hypothetical protein
VRLALVALAVLAIVLPTALVPATASAHGNVYSVRQVLRVFRAEGIPLYRQADDRPNFTSEDFTGPEKLHLDVTVTRPVSGHVLASGGYVLIGNESPHFADRGNVDAFWTTTRAAGSEATRIDAALDALRYSSADAARAALPTILLRSGQWRVVDTATTPPGTEVECLEGSADASTVFSPARPRSLTLAGDSADDGTATLRWNLVEPSTVFFSCLGVPSNLAFNEGSFPLPRSTDASCVGVSRVTTLGVAWPLPAGWFATAANKTVWLGNERRCGALRHPAPGGIYIAARLFFDMPRTVSPDPGFVLRPPEAAERMLRTYGSYSDAYTVEGHLYVLTIRLGPQARNAKSIREVEAVLRGTTRL